jgi:hypothetical protein
VKHDTDFLRFEIFSVYYLGILKKNPPRTERACERAFRKWESERKDILDQIANDNIVQLYDSFEGITSKRQQMNLVFILVHLLANLEKETRP